MRKIFLLAVGGLFMANSYAQKIDRTHPPKAGAAPIIKLADPVTFKLDNGITVLVVENHKVPSVSASYFIYTGPVTEGDKAGVMELMGGMLNQGTTKMTKAAFDEAAESDGTQIGLSSNGGSVSALDRYFDKGVMLLSQALQSPAFNQADFDKLKAQSLTGLKASEKSVDAIAGNVTGALLFGKTSPLGEFTTVKSVSDITLQDVKQAYNKYISPSNGYLTIVGDIKPEDAKKIAEKYFGNWQGAKITVPVIADVANPTNTEIDLVNVSNAVQSHITVANVVSLPRTSKDYFAALLANQILGGGADAYLFKDLREKKAYTYGAYSSISGGKYQSSFQASASVRNAVTDSAVMAFFDNIKKIRTQKVSDTLLDNIKAQFNGSFALGTENPSRIASFARSIMIYNLPKDYYRTYLQKVNAVTPEDVMNAAKKYFNYNNSRVIIVGKSGEVLKGLKTLGYPVKLYDENANPVSASSMAIPAVKAADVINKYITAIGGTANLNKIQTLDMKGKMDIRGMSIDVQMKKMAPNKQLMAMSMNGSVVSKSVYNGSTGYQLQMGNKKELSADDLKKYQDQKSLFPQAQYTSAGYKLTVKNNENINGKDAYQIEVVSPSGITSTEYYDIQSGYLVRQVASTEVTGKSMTVTIDFSNYKSVNGVMMPFEQSNSITTAQGDMVMDVKLDSIIANKGVTAEDFK